MASAYTPGLTVSGDIIVRRTRRLPIKGEVLVKVGDEVKPDQVVARALLPGVIQTIRLTEKMGVEASEVHKICALKVGDPVQKDQILAESKALFGLIKNKVVSDYTGTIESISEATGSVLVREPSIPVDIQAYILGKVAEVLPGEGAVVEARSAMVQGIFGVGGERQGRIRVAVSDPSQNLEASMIKPDDRGNILIGGSGVTYEAIQRAVEVGVLGIVAGGIKDSDLIKFLGYDIGVAITGQEQIDLTIVITEGFGYLAMAQRTFDLFASLAGQEASINGATQIRAGVIRPEVIVPQPKLTSAIASSSEIFELKIGTPVRMIREPYFGELGVVTDLPAQLVVLESGTEVRVLRAKLGKTEEEVTVPRANVEIISTG